MLLNGGFGAYYSQPDQGHYWAVPGGQPKKLRTQSLGLTGSKKYCLFAVLVFKISARWEHICLTLPEGTNLPNVWNKLRGAVLIRLPSWKTMNDGSTENETAERNRDDCFSWRCRNNCCWIVVSLGISTRCSDELVQLAWSEQTTKPKSEMDPLTINLFVGDDNITSQLFSSYLGGDSGYEP